VGIACEADGRVGWVILEDKVPSFWSKIAMNEKRAVTWLLLGHSLICSILLWFWFHSSSHSRNERIR